MDRVGDLFIISFTLLYVLRTAYGQRMQSRAPDTRMTKYYIKMANGERRTVE